ncbi:MAG: signal peptidase II [Candidatus Manganitrophus sp.]|nr:signal peptidase II [Candidatus Manganitrophus sp.]WDT69836.1 MAG: signal peptidase II [Candidatus Manganitrophus sp.]WDT73945.1 MAG: signal peptidase II [Candidatus Manganitrophus sp.]WDT78536.1 MAG: signal peptidase II [Candidatus Manganitrophus sp.]
MLLGQIKLIFLTLIGGGTIILDQITKLLIQNAFRLHESVVVIQDFFSLTYIRNPGAAFGLFADQSAGFRSVFFLVVSIVALSILLYFLAQTPKEDKSSLVAISLLFGGAVGNLIDRVRMGEVVDFLDFYVGQFHWPAFNVADSAITIGISLLMFNLFWLKKEVPTANLRGCE